MNVSVMNRDKFIAIRNELGRHWVDLKVERPLDGAVCHAYAPGFSGEELHNVGIIIIKDDACFDVITGLESELQYTHWMPMPTPPVIHEVTIKVGGNQFPVAVDPDLPPDEIVIRGRDKIHVYNLAVDDDEAEVFGDNFEKDMAEIGAKDRNIAWLKVCDPMQIPFKGKSSWSEMEQVYYNK